jgi:hypothetical protein
MAHNVSWRSAAPCPKLGVDRKWLAPGQTVANDPGGTFEVSQSETDELNFRVALETLPLKKPEAVEFHKD